MFLSVVKANTKNRMTDSYAFPFLHSRVNEEQNVYKEGNLIEFEFQYIELY